MFGRMAMLVAVLVLAAASPARAGTLEVSEAAGVSFLTYEDPAGAPDSLRIVSSADPTVTVLGPTVTAGSGCAPVPGGASCTRPAGTVWERSSIETGGGDDTVVVEAPQAMRIFGGDGNDQLTLAAGAIGSLYGMDGADVLVAAGRATLEGGSGDDRLSAGASSGLSGGAGNDVLVGSPQNDVLVDAGDRRSRDAIVCGGGDDVTQGDRGDIREGCTRGALDEISKVDYFWRVRFGPRASVPTRLRVRNTDYAGVQSPFASCRGAACHGARFDAPLRDISSFRIVSGGKRLRINGRTWRGVGPGALVRAGLQFTFGDVMFTKGLEFRTRARALPAVRKRCTVTVPPRGGRTRVVPCT